MTKARRYNAANVEECSFPGYETASETIIIQGNGGTKHGCTVGRERQGGELSWRWDAWRAQKGNQAWLMVFLYGVVYGRQNGIGKGKGGRSR